MTSKTGFESRFAANGNVKLHYVAAGSGPPLLFLHGFPDHGLGWRRQMEALCGTFTVLAPDLRGFGLSDAPTGHAQYTLLPHLVEDVLSILVAEQLSHVSVIGHDWGGTIAWWLAMRVPQAVRHLVILSTPHPRNYLRAIADPGNARYFAYMRAFQEAGAAAMPAPVELAGWVADEGDRQALAESLGRSDPEVMLGYYRANIPLGRVPDIGQLPLVKAPTLVMFGTHDPYVPSGAYDGTFREVDNVASLVAISGAGHFIHHQAAGFVTREIETWVSRPPSSFRAF
ncbi:alpha/beta fold hydrolase [Mesorhizobium humile]|uniref:Alpha/beta hydrolase n=1 Tax=Mesorhizobium humile TaxID=3072313 RepID=A0ABU4YJ62_9HYPH|nr:MULTISPECIES: alpha/beta hydrolase [unclassified Mesorhizobium]MDX8461987.1 alpha/beta hydrolase [Mesorhizobium sp. VK2D]MDX8486741.1 alpha/beta hydrolase [Mesorhizobium sp. VK2B]